MQQLEIPERLNNPMTARVTTIHAPNHLAGWIPVIWSQILFPGAAPRNAEFRWRSFAVVFVLPALLLYPWLSFHLFEPDEGRYAQIPREMLEAGEWIVPTLQGQPYLDKPPLFYWLVMISYSLFGFHDAAARLVPAVAMHLTVLLTYLLGRRVVGERSAYWGAIVVTVSPLLLGVGRLLVLDGLLTLWITTALFAAYLASCPASPRGESELADPVGGSSLRWFWWLLAGVACGLGVLTKGPVAIVLVLPPLLVQRWMAGGRTIALRGWASFFAVVAAINLPWYVLVCVERPEFVRYFLWQHNVQRFVEPFDHVRPVWFYVPIVLYGLLPTLVLIRPVVRFLTSTDAEDCRRRCGGLGYLLLAGGWCVFFYSLSGCKLPTYILPAFVPLGLALGCFLARTEWYRSRWMLGLLAVAWLIQLVANAYLVPAYARSKAPAALLEELRADCGDAGVPIVCFPRNVDSVAFYLGRSDLRTFRSKQIDALVDDLQKRPRTVVLFGHRNSPETLARHLPVNLRLVERKPMGLCERGVIVRID